jgi:hypothetical protein
VVVVADQGEGRTVGDARMRIDRPAEPNTVVCESRGNGHAVVAAPCPRASTVTASGVRGDIGGTRAAAVVVDGWVEVAAGPRHRSPVRHPGRWRLTGTARGPVARG